ncbi:GerMN domain-containing protein [Paenibacillus sp. YAF4_2]|uniref:GerMN domain-containing protein n=1 Tax=Paenibacillus sp. YAF4_2 TaxID=3233085 RepID=UPI003F9E5692
MRKPAFIILLFIVMLTAAACGNTNKSGEQSGGSGITNANVPSPSPTVGTAATVEPTPTPLTTEEQTVTSELVNPIEIYYSDTELEKLIVKEINVKFDSGQDLVKKALEALQEDGPEGSVSLWKKIEFKSITLDDNNAVTIDIHLPDEARLGSSGEQMLLDSLQKTLFQFDFVQSYDLLVDGQALESLMGHFDLEHPTIRSTNN